MPKFYHVYADGKTVRQISWEEYRKMSLSKTRYRLCMLHENEIAFRKDNNFFWVPLRQLKEILKQ